MTTYSEKPTVEILYKLFSNKKYVPYAYYCLPSEFVPSYVTKKNSFVEDELYIKQEKEFVLTTIGAPTKNRT